MPQGLRKFSERKAQKVEEQETARRLKLLKVDPATLPVEAEEIEKWTEVETTKMLPMAVLDLKYRLLYGDADTRKDASKELMDRKGYAKTNERLVAASRPMITVMIGTAPWDDGKGAKVVEGQVSAPKLMETTGAKNEARNGDGAPVREKQATGSDGRPGRPVSNPARR